MRIVLTAPVASAEKLAIIFIYGTPGSLTNPAGAEREARAALEASSCSMHAASHVRGPGPTQELCEHFVDPTPSSRTQRLGVRFPRRAAVPESDDLHRPRAAPRPRSRVHVVKYLRTVWSAHQNDVPVHEHASTCRARSSSTVAGSLRAKGVASR